MPEQSPMLFTAAYGLAAGLAHWLLAAQGIGHAAQPGAAPTLLLWLWASGYALGLARLFGRPAWRALPALALPLALLAAPSPGMAGPLLLLGIVGWARSGLCHGPAGLGRIAAEVALAAAAACLVLWMAPSTNMDWAVAVWLFFVVQSLYYAGESASRPRRAERRDRFEQARQRVERLLERDGA